LFENVDCVVIGAGVVGLACARALAIEGREVIILEQTDAIGTETSSRHSEVIHAGIYYEPGSLKAKFCVEGKLKCTSSWKKEASHLKNLGNL
jgi:L-2-hydroxyglutarate oxidase LhgO